MSERTESPELVFEFSANGKASGTTVTARIGDDVLASISWTWPSRKTGRRLYRFRLQGPARHQANRGGALLLDHAAEYAKRQPRDDEKPPSRKRRCCCRKCRSMFAPKRGPCSNRPI